MQTQGLRPHPTTPLLPPPRMTPGPSYPHPSRGSEAGHPDPRASSAGLSFHACSHMSAERGRPAVHTLDSTCPTQARTQQVSEKHGCACTDLPMGLRSVSQNWPRSQCAVDPPPDKHGGTRCPLAGTLVLLTHSAPPLGVLIACSLTTSYHSPQLRGSHTPEDCGGQLCELGQAPHPLYALGSLDASGGHSSCPPGPQDKQRVSARPGPGSVTPATSQGLRPRCSSPPQSSARSRCTVSAGL